MRTECDSKHERAKQECKSHMRGTVCSSSRKMTLKVSHLKGNCNGSASFAELFNDKFHEHPFERFSRCYRRTKTRPDGAILVGASQEMRMNLKTENFVTL